MYINTSEIEKFLGKHTDFWFSFEVHSKDLFTISYTHNSFIEIEITNKNVLITHEEDYNGTQVSCTENGLNEDDFLIFL